MPDLQPSQVSLRHLRVAAYRCFLPDLTGFTGRIAQDQRWLQIRHGVFVVEPLYHMPAADASHQACFKLADVSSWHNRHNLSLER